MAILSMFVTACSSIEASADKPNIILIMTDDIGTECFSMYGGMEYKTPNLDALASSGMVFYTLLLPTFMHSLKSPDNDRTLQ